MSWSAQQTNRIVEDFWRHGQVSCPDDNSSLKLKLRKLHGGDYDLLAECPVCGKSKLLRRGDDPLRSQFRPWTTDEIQRLMQSVHENSPPLCPICRVAIEHHSTTASSRLRCYRCGGSSLWQRPPRA